MSQLYSIMDLEQYAVSIRESAASSFSENYDENLDEFISIEQVKNLVSNHSAGMDEDDRYLINEDTHNIIFDEIRTWLHNVGLAKLAAQDLIECAWDNESNQMMFWLKNDPHIKPTNESIKNVKQTKTTRTRRKNS